jgi:hypothetical protein
MKVDLIDLRDWSVEDPPKVVHFISEYVREV